MSAANSEAIVKPEANADNYVWYLFYYNPSDDRVIVPKRCKWMGWTINFGNKKGQWLGALFVGAVAGCVYYCYHSDKKCSYTFSELYEKIAAKFGKNLAVCSTPYSTNREEAEYVLQPILHSHMTRPSCFYWGKLRSW